MESITVRLVSDLRQYLCDCLECKPGGRFCHSYHVVARYECQGQSDNGTLGLWCGDGFGIRRSPTRGATLANAKSAMPAGASSRATMPLLAVNRKDAE
jgi:hypothetical protein